ncbi:hypothetical protein ILYODFUR_029381 [Ilyodon furcidens]|uniref:Uncharacterized protein n=1 Tax=Ilyodon furcidens TaxID=33524 RepID=A0ABV0UY29_9TELE
MNDLKVLFNIKTVETRSLHTGLRINRNMSVSSSSLMLNLTFLLQDHQHYFCQNNMEAFLSLQRIQNVLRTLQIRFCSSFIPDGIKFISFLQVLHTTPQYEHVEEVGDCCKFTTNRN